MQGKKIEVTFRETSPYNIQILHKVKKNRGDKKITKLALKNYNDCGNQIFQKKNRRIKKRILYKKF